LSIDIIMFIFLAFYNTMPNSILFSLLVFAFLKKIICQALLLPVTFYLIHKLKKKENIDIYDIDTKFNPFLFDNSYDSHRPKLQLQSHVK